MAIAGVLAMDPEVIVADEPTAGLDPEFTARLLGLLDRLHANGRTIVISTHDVELALAWADHALVLRRGELLGAGPPEAVFADADLLREARLVTPIVLDVYLRLRAAGVPLPDAPRRAPRRSWPVWSPPGATYRARAAGPGAPDAGGCPGLPRRSGRAPPASHLTRGERDPASLSVRPVSRIEGAGMSEAGKGGRGNRCPHL